MLFIREVPFILQTDQLKRQLNLKNHSRLSEDFNELVRLVEETGKPKAIYKASFIDEKGPASIAMEGVTFSSPALRHNLDQVNRVFPYIATCGSEVDEIPADKENILKQVWMYTIKMSLLETSLQFIRDEINQLFKFSNLSTMNPGSGEAAMWPIEQQQELFSIFGDVEGQIGVKLLPSFLMQPDISTSGIFFPAETTFQNCQLCQRENCEYRSAAFDEALWESIN